jgi:hypothetical protein
MSEPAPTAESAAPAQSRSSVAWWRLPLLLAIVLAAIVVARSSQNGLRGPLSTVESVPPPGADSGKTVALEIDYGDGKKREFAALPWFEGMTVDDLMTAGSREKDSFQYFVQGDLAMTMLVKIDQSLNEGAAGRNWTYTVNGNPADRSLAVYELQPGDRVLWTFALPQ